MVTQRMAPTERSTAQHDDAASDVIIVVDQKGPVLPSGDAGVRLDLAELHWLAVRAGAEVRNEDMPAPSSDSVQRLEQELATRGRPSARPTALPAGDRNAPHRPPPEGEHRLITPVALALTRAGFGFVDHDGNARGSSGRASSPAPRASSSRETSIRRTSIRPVVTGRARSRGITSNGCASRLSVLAP